MPLINNMFLDDKNGVTIIKKLEYNEYVEINNSCSCDYVINHKIDYIKTNMYVILDKNINVKYSQDILDTEKVLVINQDINVWFINYINLLTTDSYFGYNNSKTETRIIYNSIDSTYYLIKHNINTNIDNQKIYAIIDQETDNLWISGTSEPYVSELSECKYETGNKIIKLRDINPMSLSYGNEITQYKCLTETLPIIKINWITIEDIETLYLQCSLESNGGFLVTEMGICYGLNRYPTINDNKIILNTIQSGSFNTIIEGLNTNTYYHFRAYAINALGISYSKQFVSSINI